MIHGFASVIIDISHEKVDRTFQYKIPKHLQDAVYVGVQVFAPFGNGNAKRRGYVVGLSDTPEFDIEKTKEIAGVVTDSMSVQSQLIQLAWWMRSTYGATMNQALKTVLPVKQKIKPREKKSIRCLLNDGDLRNAVLEAEKKNYKARVRILAAFLESSEIPFEVAENQLNVTAATIKPMAEKGYIEIIKREVYRNPLIMSGGMQPKKILTKEQQSAAEQFIRDYNSGKRDTSLLHGITGSGKTEVYMELMEHVLTMGKQVILLIPEIALTYQTVMRFYKRFGEQVSFINSRLSAGERYDQWERAMKGEISVMIGPRSALFTPFQDLGLIIIDEEHEGAYKSETMPRYHAREVAEKRAELNNAALVMGSATPSLQSYTKALAGEYTLLTLEERAVEASHLPVVEIADLREELKAGNKTIFSRRLADLIEDRLAKKEQIMLFINRRGYANFVSCRSCGEAVRCPHCDVSLTLHRGGHLVCHYCGHGIPLMEKCPSCGSPYIANFGVGTQKLETMTKKMFPTARILRMDADTTSKKGSHEEILESFSLHEADILIGTQMIVKGHDFANVTLVGIMAADLSLHTPDYRSGERTFELLVQAAGRAGRGEREGNVVIQTYCPDHYSIQAAAVQDYKSFYSKEMMYRKVMNYPPACRMSAVLFASSDEKRLNYGTGLCTESVIKSMGETIQLIGPVNAPVYKVNDIYRKILYIKSENCDILDRIRDIIEFLAAGDDNFRFISIQYDIS